MAYVTLHERLRGPIATTLQKDLEITNIHAIPTIEKVVVSVGINKSKMESKEMIQYVKECLMKITGQKPVLTKARKAISNFKTREGMVVGAMVTLRGQSMRDFLDRLLSYALPRVRDFRGLGAKLDGHGNYSIGLKDHSIFPEVPPPDAKQIFGLQIQIKTTTEDDVAAKKLLKELGVPFRPEKKEEPKSEKVEKPAPRDAEESLRPEVAKTEESPKDSMTEGPNDSETEDAASDSDTKTVEPASDSPDTP